MGGGDGGESEKGGGREEGEGGGDGGEGEKRGGREERERGLGW